MQRGRPANWPSSCVADRPADHDRQAAGIHTRGAAMNPRTLINLGVTRTDRHWSLPTPA
jgi:hypothetical protein